MIQMVSLSNQRINRNQRRINRRVIIRGLLILESPTCLSSGDSDSSTDMPLLRDSITQNALLTGASITGALRNYLHDYINNDIDLATILFGAMRQDDDGDQSPLIIHDAISSGIPTLELRDGVRIDGKTGTAADKAKYDLELLAAGTQFPLKFELLIDKKIDADDLLKGLAIALQGLEKGEIALGMKKSRGFGRCRVSKWQVWDFDLRNPQDRLNWLTYDHWTTGFLEEAPEKQSSIAKALGVTLDSKKDKRDRLTIEATFQLDVSLLIRSGQASAQRAPDVVHLKSHRPGFKDPVPVLSGTSLAGVLRHRAERIINTLGKELTIVKKLFGDVDKTTKDAQASRLIVYESVVEQSTDLVQNRIAIDRFTGGALHGALFNEQPIFGGDQTQVTIKLEVRQPASYEIGLLLLLIKDLWTSDLPVGGGSSIGRGRLKGKKAILAWHCSQPKQWKIEQVDNHQLKVEDLHNPKVNETAVKADLEVFVEALVIHTTEDEIHDSSN